MPRQTLSLHELCYKKVLAREDFAKFCGCSVSSHRSRLAHQIENGQDTRSGARPPTGRPKILVYVNIIYIYSNILIVAYCLSSSNNGRTQQQSRVGSFRLTPLLACSPDSKTETQFLKNISKLHIIILGVGQIPVYVGNQFTWPLTKYLIEQIIIYIRNRSFYISNS